ncbi:hypothetical protein [Rhodococcoides corynebacterioides]|uniref:hypothetical protein n=1 Tax=Rhodococcoides corynebacterioides TaxID=53972 RepID=UPI001C9A7649|nr:hypothetical protein [Rhodococcus corynebacterioides]MBY6351830.1 hypothetical protein [Rhodococcus corynebacterioides]MBY6364844.1 hypothetical protein [Rhodococcus corynebacterioides]
MKRDTATLSWEPVASQAEMNASLQQSPIKVLSYPTRQYVESNFLSSGYHGLAVLNPLFDRSGRFVTWRSALGRDVKLDHGIQNELKLACQASPQLRPPTSGLMPDMLSEALLRHTGGVANGFFWDGRVEVATIVGSKTLPRVEIPDYGKFVFARRLPSKTLTAIDAILPNYGWSSNGAQILLQGIDSVETYLVSQSLSVLDAVQNNSLFESVRLESPQLG